MLLNGFFRADAYNPDLPEEKWTLVYENTTPGAYSRNFGWGKYKVIISGGGGSGAAFGRTSYSGDMNLTFCNDGYAAEEKTVLLNILRNENKNLSGIIGSGGKGSSVNIVFIGSLRYDASASYGAIGTGYGNGLTANRKYEYDSESATGKAGAWVGGSGGGSSSLKIDNVLNTVVAGGNGGSVRINFGGNKTSDGGAGGSGGTINGTGATGGARLTTTSTGLKRSGDGSDGYIRIYKSNLIPEDT